MNTPFTPESKLALFGPGPWVDEPDRVEWRAHGFVCLVRRIPTLGHLCAYVGVPPSHPWHDKDPGDIDASAHGGLTSAGPCDGEVCHVPEPGEPDHLYWLGFDAAHGGDVIPQIRKLMGNEGFDGDVYRNVAWMKEQAEQLAAQAALAGSELGPPTDEQIERWRTDPGIEGLNDQQRELVARALGVPVETFLAGKGDG